MAKAEARAVPAPEFPELAVVRLCSVVGTDRGMLLPGAIGTIVYRHDGADAYEVEFSAPIAEVVTLRGSDLSPMP